MALRGVAVIGAFVQAVSAKTIELLAEQGLPQLSEGVVHLGARFLDDGMPMPRVVFVPRRLDHDAPDVIALASMDRRAQGIQRPIWSRSTTFDVHVFAAAAAPDEWTEYDAAEYLADTVICAVQELAAGMYSVGSGEWPDQDPPIQLPPQTHHMVFSLTVSIPVVELPRSSQARVRARRHARQLRDHIRGPRWGDAGGSVTP
jgi:hypothetical protein